MLKVQSQDLDDIYVNKLLIKDGVATGNYTQKNRQINATATKEVFYARVQSTTILMLSGIGPANDLKALGIHVQCDLPGVGQNLMDHLEVYVQQASQLPIFSTPNSAGLLGAIGIKWLATGEAWALPTTSKLADSSKVTRRWNTPTFNFIFACSYVLRRKSQSKPTRVSGTCRTMLSKSRGTIKLASSNPRDQPKIQFNYMSHEEDFIVFRKAIRTARSIFQQAPFDGKRQRTQPRLTPSVRRRAGRVCKK